MGQVNILGYVDLLVHGQVTKPLLPCRHLKVLLCMVVQVTLRCCPLLQKLLRGIHHLRRRPGSTVVVEHLSENLALVPSPHH